MPVFALILNLLCTNADYGLKIHVEMKVKDQSHYEVTLRDSRMMVMEMFRSELRFDELGSVTDIMTHHWVENFHITKAAEGWEGLYQYDLGYYPVTCIEKR